MVLNIPSKGNRKLEKIVKRVNSSPEIQQYWDCSNIVAVDRLRFNDHGRVHVAIVSNIALRLLRMLIEDKKIPGIVKDYKMKNEDAEVVVVLASLLHDVGHSIHRDKHYEFSLPIADRLLDGLLKGIYNVKEAVIIKSEILHAIICHHKDFHPLTIEAGCVRIADSLDAKEGRARIPFDAGRISIHSVSALAIKDVRIEKGKDKTIHIEIEMTNSAGIFQLEQLIKEKIKNSGLEEQIEVTAHIKGEEEKIIKEFRL
ncbi:MAG: HD domain-containing protein [Candidatus Diapherotrites archaeon]|nr:HD domain-containing protein [Candidatus Diapherotrites archaeon]